MQYYTYKQDNHLSYFKILPSSVICLHWICFSCLLFSNAFVIDIKEGQRFPISFISANVKTENEEQHCTFACYFYRASKLIYIYIYIYIIRLFKKSILACLYLVVQFSFQPQSIRQLYHECVYIVSFITVALILTIQ